MKKKSGKRRSRSLSLNLILWLSFLLFAIFFVILFAVGMNYQLNKQYRHHIEDNLRGAGERLRVELGDEKISYYSQISQLMLSVANEYSVRVYFFPVDGGFVYPDNEELSLSQREQIIRAVKQGNKSVWVPVPDVDCDEVGYATMLEFWNKEHYLYLSSTLETIRSVSGEMFWSSLITALSAVALSFVVSGFVSMSITKPVNEVTERAKQLARGDYAIGKNKQYFCTEVNELSEALDYAGSEISKTDKMQKELIANVSHDFKTPLTMIKAYASMIQEISGDDPEKRRKHTQIIIDETDRLAALVADVLDLSRLQAGVSEGERTVFNLSEDVYRVAGRFGYLTETQGYTLETEVDDDLYTCSDKGRVEQVLYNLIGNAFNYTGEDKRVIVRLKKCAGGARFEVIDSGRGIPKEELDTIWERYYRSGDSHKRPVRGTGLGLSIVKGVLKKYNIPFGVQSEEGKGSTFWVEFPDPPAQKEEI